MKITIPNVGLILSCMMLSLEASSAETQSHLRRDLLPCLDEWGGPCQYLKPNQYYEVKAVGQCCEKMVCVQVSEAWNSCQFTDEVKAEKLEAEKNCGEAEEAARLMENKANLAAGELTAMSAAWDAANVVATKAAVAAEIAAKKAAEAAELARKELAAAEDAAKKAKEAAAIAEKQFDEAKAKATEVCALINASTTEVFATYTAKTVEAAAEGSNSVETAAEGDDSRRS